MLGEKSKNMLRSSFAVTCTKFAGQFFRVLAVTLAVGILYSSVATNIFTWIFPDEIAAMMLGGHGLPFCLENYYWTGTINRLSSALGVCSLGFVATLFSSPYEAWIFLRFLMFILVAASASFLFAMILKIEILMSVFAGLILTAVTYFFLVDGDWAFVYGLDQSIYFLGQISFFLLVGTFNRALKYKKYFYFFCALFFLNLNSHEIYLVISGFFIPLFFMYRSGNVTLRPVCVFNVLKSINYKKDRAFWLLTLIYTASAISTMTPPSLAIRSNLWPSDGQINDGFAYILLASQDLAYQLLNYPGLLCLVFLLGAFLALISDNKVGNHISNFKLFWVFVFFAPLIQYTITAFLVGVTPTLHVPEMTKDLAKTDLSLFARGMSEITESHGGIAIRQFFPTALGMYLNFVLLGFVVVKFLLGSSSFYGNCWTKHLQPNFFAQNLFLCLTCFTLWNSHPTKDKSFELFSQFFFSSSTTETNIQSISNEVWRWKDEGSIRFTSIWDPSFSPRRIAHLGLAELSLNINTKLKASESIVREDIFEDLKNYASTKAAATDYAKYVLALFGKRFFEPCRLEAFSLSSDTECFFSDEKALPKDLASMLMKAQPQRIVLEKTTNVTAESIEESCLVISDKSKNSEHFLSARLQLQRGLTHISLRGNSYPVGVSTVIYFISENHSVIIPSVGHFGILKPQVVKQADGFDVLYNSFQKTNIGWEQNILLSLKVAKDFEMRFQHMVNGITIYKGRSTYRSKICEIQLRHIGGYQY